MKRKVDPYWAKQFGVSPQPREIERWRCGCDQCEYRIDFWDREPADEAARLHNANEHDGKPLATVYVASFVSCFVDACKDSAYR